MMRWLLERLIALYIMLGVFAGFFWMVKAPEGAILPYVVFYSALALLVGGMYCRHKEEQGEG